MSRAYAIYILMFALLGGGLWFIFTLGGAVRAPDDLSGDWVVTWQNAPPPETGEPIMRVSQSGRFFVVRFGQRPPMSLTLADDWKGARDGRQLQMRLAGGPWTLKLAGNIQLTSTWQVPEVDLELVGPTRHVGHAVRRDLPPPPASRPAGVARAR